MAEALGGDIQVRSSPGDGSTFTFTMETEIAAPVRLLSDLSETAAEAMHPPQPGLPASAQLQGRVLLAEDGPDNQALIAMILRTFGLEVDIVANGRLAVEKAMSASASYDAILMDMQMPVMDGYDATAKLRQSGYKGPIVALTAHAIAEDRRKCLAAGCDEYATKPVNRASLRALLARLTGGAQAGPEGPGGPATPAPACSDEAIRSALFDDPDMAGIAAEFVDRLPQQLADMRQAALASQ